MIARGYIMMARPGEETALSDILVELSALVGKLEGSGGIDILHDRNNPQRFLFLEKWTDEAAHKAAGSHLPKELMGRLMATLDGPPDGAYYDYVGANV